MKLVIFSDIHGNQYAFREFILQLGKMNSNDYDAVIFCGDILGYYYGQTEIVQGMIQLNNMLNEEGKRFIVVRGNHDEFGLQISQAQRLPEEFWPKYGHSYGQTDAQVIEYVQNLPTKVEIDFDGVHTCIVHGTPLDELDGRQYPADDVSDELSKKYQEYDLVIGGHTHFRMDRYEGCTRIINPGSLGQQRDGRGFCFAKYDTNSGELEYITIRFDIAELERDIMRFDPDNEKLRTILHRGEN